MLVASPHESPPAPTDILALLIASDRSLARDLSLLIKKLELPVDLVHEPTGDCKDSLLPDVVFTDAEVGPVALKSARIRFPDAKHIAIVGRWSETEVEVRGYADWTLHKPLRQPEFRALQRLFEVAPDRLIA
jgi:hypothetical protein